ncbi:MAG: oxygen-independent coproporphyrinogen III oxidase [Lachnospiraceae bacterium]|nr:oxygen-independent coproporphyrinogen III oxidase [Lachnospiraceae bacterium]
MKKSLGIYIHIPFCVRKCRYCDFLSGPARKDVQEKYVTVLLKEIEQYAELLQSRCVETIFFGGGTPSILEGNKLLKIMDKLREFAEISETAEITIEVNPGTVTEEKLLQWKQAGINRISFGLQSADNDELKCLGRIHTWEAFEENYHLARKCGFDNINVDLMSALPGQTVETWKRTMERVTALNPEHISAYSLIIEEGTPFYDAYSEHPELLPSEEDERTMYYETKSFLAEKGYERYEISNYSKPGYECRHNLSYWERIDYLGFGLGAASLLGNIRKSNQTDLSEYLKGNFEGEREVLSDISAMEEYFFLGLRKMKGVDWTSYQKQYENTVEKLVRDGLLEKEGAYIRLTELGIDVSNFVLEEFLID